jgi:hypothetical protein
MMAERTFSLSAAERKRLVSALRVGLSIPVIDDVEDFIWEAIFAYVKGLDLAAIRNKRLFDAVGRKGEGWSLKTLVWPKLTAGTPFEFVIQRADIFKKSTDLGFLEELARTSDVTDLGRALILHWNRKWETDSAAQNVTDPRVAVLLKSVARKRFVYVGMVSRGWVRFDWPIERS